VGPTAAERVAAAQAAEDEAAVAADAAAEEELGRAWARQYGRGGGDSGGGDDTAGVTDGASLPEDAAVDEAEASEVLVALRCGRLAWEGAVAAVASEGAAVTGELLARHTVGVVGASSYASSQGTMLAQEGLAREGQRGIGGGPRADHRYAARRYARSRGEDEVGGEEEDDDDPNGASPGACLGAGSWAVDAPGAAWAVAGWGAVTALGLANAQVRKATHR
jgi:hypothetical protein